MRTVDDVFLEIATWRDIGRFRRSLARLRQLGAGLDLHAAAACCARLRPVRMPPAFSLTVSFVGKRTYTSEEIKAVLAYEMERKHRGWVYQQDDRAADLNVRVFIEHDVAAVGVRLAKAALHDRWYRRVQLPGALKPSVAAALVLLAQTTSTTRVLDPCCGSGTNECGGGWGQGVRPPMGYDSTSHRDRYHGSGDHKSDLGTPGACG